MLDEAILQRLYRYSYALTADKDDAYDLLHDAIERLLRSAYTDQNTLEPYIRRIIRNRFIDQYRQQQRQVQVIDCTAAVVVDICEPDLAMVRLENQMQLQQIWPLLEAIDREILYFWAYEDCSAQEVAEQLDLPRGTVLSRMHRIQGKLAKLLAKSVANTG